ncbi:hypothetical protein BZA70DRAFT_174875 [Myxozyma melibiosi]|uniref:Late endosomal/lysosomal adaptor and MAPK and MTOR activator 1 n=1 Tax=Myxozyma melibiosi TaxID=54550 RepID=A0ABR1F5N7_9ASCO
MGVCMSCTKREEDDLFPTERTGLLAEYGPTTMTMPNDSASAQDMDSHREEAMARIVAMTEENLIDIFAVGTPDRRVNGQPTVDYKYLLSSIEVLESDDQQVDEVIPLSDLTSDETTLLEQLGKASKEYVDSLYKIKSVGPLLVTLED